MHLTLGLLLNASGLTIMVLANSWATFMMAPSGVNEVGAVVGNIWEIMKGPLWNPINLHRFIANIGFGGAVVGAYAAFKFLSTTDPEKRAHYDWMGYTSNVTTHPYQHRAVPKRPFEWRPADCIPDLPWSAGNWRCGNRPRRAFLSGSTPTPSV